jgi:hypothetical protein
MKIALIKYIPCEKDSGFCDNCRHLKDFGLSETMCDLFSETLESVENNYKRCHDCHVAQLDYDNIGDMFI